MKFQLFVCLCLLSSVLAAQDLQRAVLASGGGSYIVETADATYYVSQTIGQSGAIGTIGQDGVRLRQGFQQPPLMLISSPEDKTDLAAKLYPNPVQYQLNIQLLGNLTGQLEFQLFDTTGKLVREVTYPLNREISVDLSDLASGVYLVRLQHQEKLFTSRIIKN